MVYGHNRNGERDDIIEKDESLSEAEELELNESLQWIFSKMIGSHGSLTFYIVCTLVLWVSRVTTNQSQKVTSKTPVPWLPRLLLSNQLEH